jgi:ABC-type antimicrobial peptide transport system permease subunit
VRQLLTESAILAAAGTGLGFALGAWGVRLLLLVAPGNIPRLTDTNGLRAAIPVLDLRVAGFTVTVAALTVILFGLFPALRVSNPDLATALKEGGGRAGTCMDNARFGESGVIGNYLANHDARVPLTSLVRVS